MRGKILLGAGSLALAISLPSAAMAIDAVTTANLNLRAGPGFEHEVMATMPSGDAIEIQGCLEDEVWCQVTWEGNEGWASEEFLTVTETGERMTVDEARTAGVEMPVPEYPIEPAAPPTAAEGRQPEDGFTRQRALGGTEVPEYPVEPEAPPTAAEGRDDTGELGGDGVEAVIPDYSIEPEAPPTAATGRRD